VAFINLIENLFNRGLGDFLLLHTQKGRIYLGKLLYEKGRMIVKDRGYLSSIKSDDLVPCWKNGILGMVCDEKDREWESLTFYGLEKCEIKPDLSKTRHLALSAAENQYGDNLIDFEGSFYRGFQLMLDNHFLPVLLIQKMRAKSGTTGLAVCDLRAAPMDLAIINKVNDVVRASVEKHLTLAVEDDVKVDQEQFNKLFGNYLKQG